MKKSKKSKSSGKEITIKSIETRILFGLMIMTLGIAGVIAPFFVGKILESITKQLGYSSIFWGLCIVYFSMRFIVKSDFFKSYKVFFGLALLSLVVSVFLTFWIPDESLIASYDFSRAGGQLGFLIHSYLQSVLGQLIEFIIIIVFFLVAYSLITGVSLEQIKDFFVAIFSGIFNLFKKASPADEIKDLMKDGEEYIEGLGNIKIKGVGSESQNANQAKNAAKGSMLGALGSNVTGNLSSNVKIHSHENLGEGVEEFEEDEYIGDEERAAAKANSNAKAANVDTEDDTEQEVEDNSPTYPDWQYPPVDLLNEPVKVPQNNDLHKKNALVIEKTLKSFGVQSRVVEISVGPTVVQYALSITIGTKVAKVRNLANDLALALAAPASTVRIEAPIPGTSLIGIEIPNKTPNFVYIKEMIQELEKEKGKYELPLILGRNVSGKPIIKDITSMPHLLVAGATGTGKSVGINSIIVGMLMTKSPDELKMILVDPKMVEMAPYNGIPHLMTPVITDMELVVNALQWAIEEMMRRYRILRQAGVKKIKEYNQKLGYNAMPYLVIIIDEMADLMLTTGVDVESKIVRLSQMARAVGIHLILATQRPSVDVITGLIKANVPGRIGFSVATAIDSRVIIDQVGAESLIGKGDMLFKFPELPRPLRIQGAWTDTKDVDNIINFIKSQVENVEYSDEITAPKVDPKAAKVDDEDGGISTDSMFEDALNVVVNAQKASASLLQRKLRIGYARAARLIDEMQEAGIIGAQEGSGPRKVLITSVDQVIRGKSTGGSASSVPDNNEFGVEDEF